MITDIEILRPAPSLVAPGTVLPAGPAGPGAYEDAVAHGFVGSFADWVATLKSTEPGPSAYDLAVATGFSGTVAQWLTSLVSTTPGPPGSATSNSAFALTGTITPAAISTDQDDYNPAGLSNASRLIFSASTSGRRFNSLYAPGGDGDIKTIVNGGTEAFILTNAAATGTASRRFAFPGGDVTLKAGEAITLQYDGTLSRWRPRSAFFPKPGPEIPGPLILKGTLRPAALSADVVDYNPAGLADASTLYLQGGVSGLNIASMVPNAGAGDTKLIVNNGVRPMTVRSEGSGTAANRFRLPADVTLNTGEAILLAYDSDISRWRGVAGWRAPTVAPLAVPPASTRYATEFVLPSGHRLWAVDRQALVSTGPQEGRDGVAIANGVHLDNTLRNAATTAAYAGGLGNPYLWLKRPIIGADLKANVLANLSRLPDEAMWEPAVLDTSGLAINPAWASRYVILIISMGNSFNRGGPSAPLTAKVISVSAVDPGWALMPDLTNVDGDLPSLPSTGGRWADDPRDMGAYAPGASGGEPPLVSMAKILSTNMLARGSKLKTFTAGFAQGGHRLVELMRGFVPVVSADASGVPGTVFDPRPGGIYEAAMAGLQKMADWCRRNSLIPILGPLIMQHGANDALARTTGRKYAQLLQKMLADFNEDAKAILGLSPFARDVPMIIVQDSTKSPVLQPATGVRVFSPDATTPSMAQWALSRLYPEKFIISTAEYPWPVGPDNIHKLVSSYYRQGEVIAPTIDRTMWGKPLRQGVKGIVRVSPTETQLFLHGGAWESGADGQITPPADGAKGVVAWRVGSPGTPISISAADVHADERRVVVTHEALTGGPTSRIAFDIAQWANDDAPHTCGGPVLGPRSTLRLKNPVASTLPEWNDPDTGSPFSAIDNFIPVPPARVYATEDTGSYYAVDGDIL